MKTLNQYSKKEEWLGTKIKVESEEHSRQIQQALFDLGVKRASGEDSPAYFEMPILLVHKDGCLTYCSHNCIYCNSYEQDEVKFKLSEDSEMEVLEKKLKEAQAVVDQLESKIESMKEIELSDGNYYVKSDGSYIPSWRPNIGKNFGAKFKIEEHAKKAAKRRLSQNRIEARACEIMINQGLEDYSQDLDNRLSYFVVFNVSDNKWRIAETFATDYLAPYMPASVADQLCDELNSGRFKVEI